MNVHPASAAEKEINHRIMSKNLDLDTPFKKTYK
jgi:hypothetical protein